MLEELVICEAHLEVEVAVDSLDHEGNAVEEDVVEFGFEVAAFPDAFEVAEDHVDWDDEHAEDFYYVEDEHEDAWNAFEDVGLEDDALWDSWD